jgi:putative phage-type endonuclease
MDLEIRKTGVGGSDIAILAGISRYKTPYELYLEKIGESEPTEETPAQYWGKILEEIVAQEYAKQTGKRVKKTQKTYRDKTDTHLIGHLDRLIVGEKRILECKTTRFAQKSDWGEEDSDEVPPAYLLQCQHYMEITGIKICDLALLASGSDFRIYTINHDPKIGLLIRKLAKEFWNMVQTRNPPLPVNMDDVKRQFPHGKEDSVFASPEIIDTIQRLREVTSQIKELEVEEEQLKTAILAELKENSYLLDGSGNEIVTYKNQSTKRVDSELLQDIYPDIYKEVLKESNFRKFTLKKGKT